VGFYSSPHLLDIRERIQISGIPISREDFVRQFQKLRPIAQDWESHHPQNPISHFEYLTAMALSFFKEQRPEIVLLETGLGGRCDATTATAADLTVITSLHYDHQAHLGQTLGEIAREKAGILLPKIPLVLGNIRGEALGVLREEARARDVPLLGAFRIGEEEWAQHYAHLPLYQRDNLGTAKAVVEQLREKFPLPPELWHRESPRFHWPCRWECFSNGAGGEIVLDGAHNLEGAEAVLREIERHRFLGKSFRQLIFGSIEAGRARAMLEVLASPFEEIFLVADGYERHLSAEELLNCLPRPFLEKSRVLSLAQVGALLPSIGKKLITGSLYLLGSILKNHRSLLRKLVPDGAAFA
jgi:dihydrofolate synthase/folylpolyglutamate synthase